MMKSKERKLYFFIIVGIVLFSLYWHFWLASGKNGKKTIRDPAIVPDEEGCYIKMENGECAEPGSF